MKTRISLRPAVALVAVLAALVPLAPVEATNGYLIHGIGTRAKALAGAGVALPQDALSPGTNPAGLAWVGKRYDLGLGIFNPNREHTITGAPSGFPGTFGLAPGTVESDSEYFIVPNFGLSWELSPNSAAGLALYGQGGMNTDYPARVFGGTQPTGVDLSQLFIVPTWAKRFGGGNHAIGISPIIAYQMFEARGLQAFGGFSSNPGALTNNSHDDSIGFGAKVGYLGEWTPSFSFGASYQTEIGMDDFGDYAGLFAEQGGFDIPANMVLGIAVRFGGNAVFLLDYQEIYYSEIGSVGNPLFPNLGQALGGDPNSLLGGSNGPGFGWQDMEVIKVGVQWGNDPWTWRVGYSTGDQPIPATEVLFNILAPGVMEEHITIGFSKKMRKGEFNFALMHAPSNSVSGPNPLEAPGFQTIELKMDQWDVEVGYSWGF